MHSSDLDKGGKFIIGNLLDRGMDNLDSILNGTSNSPHLIELSEKLKEYDTEKKKVIQGLVLEVLKSTTHDFLFALEESSDFQSDISLVINGKNITELSDGLQGELFSSEGWIEKYSIYKDFFTP